MAKDYDVLIVGGGLAGLTAGMYAARYGLSTGLIEQMMGGAQIINVEKIDNFPGFPQGISGAELGPVVQEQAMDAGAELIMAEATGISLDGRYKVISSDGGDYRAKTVIVAAGSTLRRLGILGEDELYGRGVSQCATCDGPLYMGQVVGVVGGGDSAADEALVLAKYADKVLLFHRRDQLLAQQALQDQVNGDPKIEVVRNSRIEEIVGEETVSGVRVRDLVTNVEDHVNISGLFVYVGLEPNSHIVRGLIEVDNAGHIPVNTSMETPVPGVYAVGDIRQNSAAQLVSAAGDGATAAIAAFKYVKSADW